MAANPVSNSYMQALLKTVYLGGVDNLKAQTSPLLSKLKKERWEGGKEIKYAAQYASGGNAGSDYATLVSSPDVGARNIEWSMTQGFMTSFFTVDQPDILMSANDRGAYMKILSNKMHAAFYNMSRTLATYLYGGSYGVIGQIPTQTTILTTDTSVTINLTSAACMRLDVGSKVCIATNGSDNTAKPSDALVNSGMIFTVSAIDDTSVTFTFTSPAANTTLYVGDYIELYTSRYGALGGATSYGPEGLLDIIPTIQGERSNNASWAGYIATAFRGVDRSVAENRLAGQYVAAASSGTHRLTDAMVSLLKKTKRSGGVDDIIIVNDEKFDQISQEIGNASQLWQGLNMEGSKKNSFTAGYSDYATAFGAAFIDRLVIDPYCDEDLAYMLNKDDLAFYDLADIGRVIAPVANDEVGRARVEATSDQGFGDTVAAKINWDRVFNIEPGSAGVYGPQMRISVNSFGNFLLRDVAGAGVAYLA